MLGLVILSANISHSAPKQAKPKQAKPAQKVSAPYSISVYEDYGGVGGRNAGASEGWTLRSDGKAEHMVSFTPAQMDDELSDNPSHTTGTFNAADFTALYKYLQYSKLFDLKTPPVSNGESFTTVSLKRGNKTRSITIPGYAPDSAATTAVWAVNTLVRSMVAGTDWKNGNGLSVNTGLQGRFVMDYPNYPQNVDTPPSFAVHNVKGKEVGVLQQSNEMGNFRLFLVPGVYKIVPETAPATSTPSTPAAAEYIWAARPATVTVSAGQMTDVNIVLEKKPATP